MINELVGGQTEGEQLRRDYQQVNEEMVRHC